MLRVTRYDSDGKVFHTCLTETAELDTNGTTHKISVSMPMRYWLMLSGGSIVIEAAL